MTSTTIATHLCLFLCCAVYRDSTKYVLLSGNSNEDRIGKKKKRHRSLIFLTTFWCTSNKHPNYTQCIHTMTHKDICAPSWKHRYLKTTDSLLYYCQGAASSEKKVTPGKYQPSNVYASVRHLLKIWNNLLLVLLKQTHNWFNKSLIRLGDVALGSARDYMWLFRWQLPAPAQYSKLSPQCPECLWDQDG